MTREKMELSLIRIVEVDTAVSHALGSNITHQFSMDMRELKRTTEVFVKDRKERQEEIRTELKESFKKDHKWESPFIETEDDYLSCTKEDREMLNKFNTEFSAKIKELDQVKKEIEVFIYKDTEIEEERKNSEKRHKEKAFSPTGNWYLLMGELIVDSNKKKSQAKKAV